MASVVLYFHVHQPYRIRPYNLFSIGNNRHYFDSQDYEKLDNQKILNKVASKCYLPTNKLFLKLLKEYPSLCLSFSISGIVIDQLNRFNPEALDSFKRLVDTGRVELLAETYYHSLACLYSSQEFIHQINLHHQTVKDIFSVEPTAFRNTELIYNNDIAKIIEDLGYSTILAEGVDRYLKWRSPNFVYQPQGTTNIRLLLKNYQLSDDIAFRFSNQNWNQWPLTAEKFAQWINNHNSNGQLINLFMDYETFGEHQWQDSGIFDFLSALPHELLRHSDNDFLTISEASQAYPSVGYLDFPQITSWADTERDLSAWISNPMQSQALKTLYGLEEPVMSTGDTQLIEDWRRLTASDHFYYMCTKWFSDGDVHKYFSPNETPFEAHNHFMNVLHDIRLRVYATKDNSKSKSILS